ncbi:MAG: SDR family NAD(P)-dependent oxidoreductase [Pseudomonadota bacterium]
MSDEAKIGRMPPVAVVGLAGRYPQSDDHYQFWARIAEGGNLIEEIPGSRFNHAAYYRPGRDRKFDGARIVCKHGAFIRDHDAFDAAFFDIAPGDVPFMDPQERIALETTWSCIEDAGYTPSSLGRKVGVFSGITYNEYQKLLPISSHATLLTNRVAHCLDFTGPAITTDAGCCSSLSAIHLACQNLALGGCDAAVVVGANLVLHVDHYTSLTGLLSTSGKPVSNPFGQDDGWIPAEGVVSVVLKRLADAQRDRDHIYAVIKSSAVEQDGRTSWFGAFNPNRQAELIRGNLERAGVHPETISYVEAASNGSGLGDAIEYEGIGKAFSHFTARKNFCAMGSVKSNAGHGEGVSTLMQLTKLIQQFQTRKQFPAINLDSVNPNLRTGDSPVYLLTQVRDWNTPHLVVNGGKLPMPRRATISSFGGGGNLGHLILEEAPARPAAGQAPQRCFIPISAKSPQQLQAYAARLLEFIERREQHDLSYRADNNLPNAMFTLCTGRVAFRERAVFIADSFAALARQLRDFLAGAADPDTIRGSVRPVDGGAVAPHTLREWQSRGAWHELAQAWVQGAEPDWEAFFRERDVRRIPLPTVCFNKTRFEIRRVGADRPAERPAQDAAAPTDAQPQPRVAAADPDADEIVALFSRVLKVPLGPAELERPISEWGLNSLMVMELSAGLEKSFAHLPKTVFFEARSLAQLREAILRRGERIAAPQAPAPVSAPAIRRAAAAGAPCRDVAIIGLSGRYPKAADMDAFWANLRAGVDAIEEIPASRWNWRDYFSADRKRAGDMGKTYSKWGGFLDDLDKFDPLLFGISPLEADFMDPQERLFLQAAWEALEDAGHTRDSIKAARGGAGRLPVGVYVGATWQEYQLYSQGRLALNDHAFCTLPYNISARISYFFDLSGECLTLDTACSSSLVAIHQACRSLIDGSNYAALAGGVNTSVHPNKYVVLASAGFLSSKGRCESFAAGGDGYVPAEGVGCLLLKRLDNAERDGDPIHAVIKGSAVNHGGRSNGYSVPNPQAQSEVVERALEDAGVDPSDIGYLEAHGTGTALGDPIEVEGLRLAFGKRTQRKQYCAIGSVKSNIGHCESAAGIAGLTKILLQLKYGQVVPSLHCAALNPDIAFEQTPFFVARDASPWLPAAGGPPRAAGVSSFGAGGTNAHVVVAEYPARPADDEEDAGGDAGEPVLVPLSARSEAQLKEYARKLALYIDRHVLCTDPGFRQVQAPATSAAAQHAILRRIGYTLQVGREQMAVRTGFAVHSVQELRQRLEDYHRAPEQASRPPARRPATGGSQDEVVQRLLAARDHAGLLDHWVNGGRLDWAALHAGRPAPRRISLPTYAFARKKAWIVRQDAGAPASASGLAHPGARLLEPSDGAQVYQFRFGAAEPVLADHVIQGARIFPGVGYLDIARQALGADGQAARRITDVVWMRPAVADDAGLELRLSVQRDPAGAARFEVAQAADAKAVLCKGASQPVQEVLPAPVDLAALRALCRPQPLDGQEVYRLYGEAGLQYGPSYRGIEQLHLGKDTGGLPFALARVAAWAQPAGQEGFHLYPGVLDSALQTSLGFLMASATEAGGGKVSVPFAVDRIDFLRPCPPQFWVWTRQHGTRAAAAGSHKLDISLVADDGSVCVELAGFTLRELQPQGRAGAASGAPEDVVLFEPAWTPADAAAASTAVPPPADRILVLAAGFDIADREQILARYGGQLTCHLATDGGPAPDARYQACAEAVFGLVKRVLQGKPVGRKLLQVVQRGAGAADACLAGVAALLATAAQENPNLRGQTLQLDAQQDIAAVCEGIDRAAALAAGSVRAGPGGMFVKQLAEVTQAPPQPGAAGGWRWPQGGVFLITGGLGGLGRLVAQEIASRAGAPRIVLTGRSSAPEQAEAVLHALRQSGAAAARYVACDVCSAEQVAALVDGVVREFGTIDGIYHVAGLACDNYVVNKSEDEFRRVLAPKVRGTVNLDQATRQLVLDHFVLFSSVAGAFGNPGQADYAAANGFLDEFAAHRNGLRAQGTRQGRTLSVNWPFWRDGGMSLDPAIVERLQSRGMSPMSSATGMAVLADLLAAPQAPSNRLVMVGSRPMLLAMVAPPPQAPAREPAQPAGGSATAGLDAAVLAHLLQLVSDVLKVDVADIDADTDMADYGFDSISLLKFGDLINEKFSVELSATIYFEYPTLSGIAAFLASAHAPAIAAALPGHAAAAATPQPEPAASAADTRPEGRQVRAPVQQPAAQASDAGDCDGDDIAVVGLAGRYPKAGNLDEFWDNILNQVNCAGTFSVQERRWEALLGDPDDPHVQAAMEQGFCAGLVDGADRFDAGFFDIDEDEARLMDPQKRLFLETAWNVLEDAGYTREDLKAARTGAKVGVFVASMNQHYNELLSGSTAGREQAFSASYTPIANTVSSHFDFCGPSITLDTLSAGSLTAVHMACESIRCGSCDYAIAGGVNLLLHPLHLLSLNRLNIASKNPQSTAFGAGDGWIPAEGVGAVLLTRLSTARARGDHVYGVIKASSANHTGRLRASPKTQALAIADTIERAGIDPRQLGYVECSANGSTFGDALELQTLSYALDHLGVREGRFALGTVQSNIGHPEAASGIAQLSKMLLQLKHRVLAPTVLPQGADKQADLRSPRFHLQRQPQHWEPPATGGRVGLVTSLGWGGSSSHVVVGEDRSAQAAEVPAVPATLLLCLSARSARQLARHAQGLLQHVRTRLGAADMALLHRLAYTLQACREPMGERACFTFGSRQELLDKLEALVSDGDTAAAARAGIMRSALDGGRGRAPEAAGAQGPHEAAGLSLDGQGLAAVAQRWLQGQPVPWDALYGPRKPAKLPLPGLPFEGERYWLDDFRDGTQVRRDGDAGNDAPVCLEQ